MSIQELITLFPLLSIGAFANAFLHEYMHYIIARLLGYRAWIVIDLKKDKWCTRIPDLKPSNLKHYLLVVLAPQVLNIVYFIIAKAVSWNLVSAYFCAMLIGNVVGSIYDYIFSLKAVFKSRR